jgi:hypothetical protein
MLPFNILSELAININRNKIKQVDILTEAGDETKRVNKLHHIFSSASWKSVLYSTQSC